MNSFLRSKSFQIFKVLHQPTCAQNNLINPGCYQCIRWKTSKPRWLPTAKTKMFRVPERRRLPPDEEAYKLFVYNNYKTYMKAFRYYYAEQTKSQTTGPEVIAEQERLEQEEHENCFKINEEWNKEVAKIREERTAIEAMRRKENVLERIQALKLAELEKIKAIDEMVRQEKENSATFITPENIDEAIEKALSQTNDFNYCIDLDGHVYKGLKARPGVSEPSSLVEAAASQSNPNKAVAVN